MRTPLVAGNWKMNGTRDSVRGLVVQLVDAEPFKCQVMVCPPYVFLEPVRALIDETSIVMGAQNIDWHESGAYTGEVSAEMIKEAGCDYALTGHSERRACYGETDDIVAEKFAACRRAGLKPILCIGETLAQRRRDETGDVVTRQVDAVLERCGADALGDGVIAYEPVWAIGTGESATPDQAEEVHRQVRASIGRHDANIAENIRILYGGSVNADNARALFEQENIDGALVGGASLKAQEFITICRAAG